MATAAQLERTTEPCGSPTLESVEDNVREARRVVSMARHAAEDAASEAASNIRRHPLRAVGTAVAVGALVGGLFAFSVVWCARSRR